VSSRPTAVPGSALLVGCSVFGDRSGYEATGAPTTLDYDPPWALPFLRRYEMVVPVGEARARERAPSARPATPTRG